MADDSDIQFPINEALLEEASKIKQERSLVKERILRIEEKKNEVSPTVYQKVKHDYQVKLKETTDALLEKKTDIDRELAGLYATRSKITENLEQNKEALEELKFRFDLGEFDKSAFNKESSAIQEKVGKFEKLLTAVSSNVDKYESIFEGEEGIAETAEPSIKKKPSKILEKDEPPASLLEGSDYNIDNEGEGDYFAPETENSHTPMESSSDVTKKTALTKTTGEARVIMIEGEHAGQEYKLGKENSIGRANTNFIVIKDAKVSRQHAVIKQSGNEFVILDLNSSNGISVNHERVKEHVLGDGDQIQIGDHIMQFKA